MDIEQKQIPRLIKAIESLTINTFQLNIGKFKVQIIFIEFESVIIIIHSSPLEGDIIITILIPLLQKEIIIIIHSSPLKGKYLSLLIPL